MRTRYRLGQLACRRIGPAQIQALRQDDEPAIRCGRLANRVHSAIEVGRWTSAFNENLSQARKIAFYFHTISHRQADWAFEFTRSTAFRAKNLTWDLNKAFDDPLLGLPE